MRHCYESVITRFPATATAFPSQVQVQMAFKYLQAPGRLAIAQATQRHRHVTVFYLRLEVGANRVFASSMRATTTATASSSRLTSSFVSSRVSASRSSIARSSIARSSVARSSVACSSVGSLTETAIAVNSSPSPSPAPLNRRRSRPLRYATATATASSSAADPTVNDNKDKEEDKQEDKDNNLVLLSVSRCPQHGLAGPHSASGVLVATATGYAAATRSIRCTQRSGDGSRRNVPIANPVLDKRITVGEQRYSASATANAVIAGFN